MSPDRLNSDELGEKGESRFKEICADAKLICNRSERDRTGWDFIVEFPIKPVAITLDRRPSPISSHFQIKTMWATNDACSIRLSAAERLAKDHKPAFIYVFKVNEDLKFVQAHLIHVRDGVLATILKRLRIEELRGSSSINKKKIKFVPSKVGEEIAPSGDALREAIENHCGEGMEKYVGEKIKQINNLGFGNDRRSLRVVIEAESKEDLQDVFLGIKEGRLASLEEFETRFGIELKIPLASTLSSGFKISPIGDNCSVVFRSSDSSRSVSMPAKVIVPVIRMPEQIQPRGIIRSPFFELQTRGRNVSFISSVPSSKFPIEDWIKFAKMRAIFAEGGGTITLVKPNVIGPSLPLSVEKAEDLLEHEQALATAEMLKLLVELSGLSDIKFEQREIFAASEGIKSVHQIATGSSEVPKIILSAKPSHDRSERVINALFVSYLQFSEGRIGFSARTTLTPFFTNDVQWEATSFEFQEIVGFSKLDSYTDFLTKTKSKAGLEQIIFRPTDPSAPYEMEGF